MAWLGLKQPAAYTPFGNELDESVGWLRWIAGWMDTGCCRRNAHAKIVSIHAYSTVIPTIAKNKNNNNKS